MIRQTAAKIRESITAATCAHCGKSIGVRKADGAVVVTTANRKILYRDGVQYVKCKCGEMTPVRFRTT